MPNFAIFECLPFIDVMSSIDCVVSVCKGAIAPRKNKIIKFIYLKEKNTMKLTRFSYIEVYKIY